MTLQWEVEHRTGPLTGDTTTHTARSRHDDRSYEICEFGFPGDMVVGPVTIKAGQRMITLSMKIDGDYDEDGEEQDWCCHGVDDVASAKAEAEEDDAMTLENRDGQWILVGEPVSE